MRRVLTTSVLSLVFCWISSADAQVCSGELSFAVVPVRALVGIGLTSTTQTYQVGARLGQRHVFGEAEIGIASHDGVGSALAYGAGLGAQLGGHDARVQLCPMVSLGFTHGPNDIAGTGIDYRENHVAVGADFGIVLLRRKSTQLAATSSFAVVNTHYKLSSTSGDSTARDNWSVLALGLGLGLNDHVTVSPFVGFPFGLRGAETLYGMGITMKIGRTR